MRHAKAVAVVAAKVNWWRTDTKSYALSRSSREPSKTTHKNKHKQKTKQKTTQNTLVNTDQ